jgi:ABC-2 type transport system ATP-binding protein
VRARDLLDRFDLAGAIVGRPPVLFLDEPTTGLDPRSRTQMWGVIRGLVGQGTTLLLTTQYLEEADQLADDIVVIDHGREIAHGTADALKAKVGGERIEITVKSLDAVDRAREILARISGADGQLQQRSRTLAAPVSGGPPAFREVLRALDEAGIDVYDVGLRRPTLDDVFLTLTGHAAAPAEDPETAEVTA